jgi:hypothetical protein
MDNGKWPDGMQAKTEVRFVFLPSQLSILHYQLSIPFNPGSETRWGPGHQGASSYAQGKHDQLSLRPIDI